jgi:excisionase family DNA binding protein
MSELLTAAEVAQRLRISVRRVYELVSDGLLPYYRFGSDMRFEPADLAACDQHLINLRSARILRELERLRLRIPEAYRPPSDLTPEEQAIAAKRHRRLRMAPWADAKAIRAIYADAQRMTRETGQPHHVDHVIPLQGEFVSGLHVHNNLQILTGTENSRKRNKFEVTP